MPSVLVFLVILIFAFNFIATLFWKSIFLEVDSVHKRYDIQSILSDVYLKCETNDIIGLLGRNGSENLLCWKSSSELLKMILSWIDEVVKTKTSDLFNEISYLSDNFIPNQLSVKKAISLSINGEDVDDFYNDEMIQSFSNRKRSCQTGITVFRN
jgi:ABC-type lipopolysaccharide export system ATPase subunit